MKKPKKLKYVVVFMNRMGKGRDGFYCGNGYWTEDREHAKKYNGEMAALDASADAIRMGDTGVGMFVEAY